MHRQLLFSLSLLTVPAAAQSLLTAGPGGMFLTLTAAVAAASDGDAIEVSGWHDVSGLRIDKSLRIFGTGILFGAPLTVAVPAGKQLELASLNLGFFVDFNPLDLTFANCLGRVTLLGVSVNTGCRIINCRQVLVSDSSILRQVFVNSSTVVFERCRITGEYGSQDHSRQSSIAASFAGADVRCVDTVFQGGNGDWHQPNQYPGSGALVVYTSTLSLAGANTSVLAGTFTTTPAIVMYNGTLLREPHINPTVQLSSTAHVVRDIANVGATVTAQSIDLRLRSPLGTFGAIVVGFPADRTVLPGIGAAWLDPQSMCIAVMGVQNGNLGWTALLPQAPGLFAPHYRWQAATFANGAVSLSEPGALLPRWWP